MILKIAKVFQNLSRQVEGFAHHQRGSVLVLVMVVMATLTILGMALGSVAFNDQLQAVRQQKNNEAYYLARSGAETAASLLLEKLNNGEDVTGYLAQLPARSDVGNGSFEVEMTEEGDGTIRIQSTGYAGNHSEKVALTLVGDPGGLVFDMAVFSTNSITLGGGSTRVNGDVGTNLGPQGIKVNSGCEITGKRYHYLNREYPQPDFPSFPSINQFDPENRYDSLYGKTKISANEYYENMTINGNFTIDVGTGERIIRAKKLEIGSHAQITIEGSGVLKLYIDEAKGDGLKIYSDSTINNEGNVGQVMIYYKGDKDFVFYGTAKIFGCLYILKANLILHGSGGVYGVVYSGGDGVEIRGNTEGVVTVLYAPNATVDIRSTGKLYGAIVCDTFFAGASGSATYDGTVNEIWEEVPAIDFNFNPIPGTGSATSYQKGRWSD